MTLDQMFEGFRKASMSSLQMQQEMFRQWTQQVSSTPVNPMNGAAPAAEWGQKAQHRVMEVIVESLNRHRETIDSSYKLAIQFVEQGFSVTESKTPEDFRRRVDELRQKMFETFKDQSEAQIRDFQKGAEKWFDMLPKA